MSIEEMARTIAENFVTKVEDVPAELEKLVTVETQKFLTDVAPDALGLGLDYVKALLFAEAIQLVELGATLTDAQVAALSTEELLRREALLAVQAQQMAVVAAAEAEKQVAALVVRQRARAFLNTILEKAGQIGLGVLTQGLF